MINEFITENANKEKRIYCETEQQAFEKLKFLFPNTYQFIGLKKGRSFADFDDFIENRNK